MIDFLDFARDMACPMCGAEAYIEADSEGMMRVRWRCEHSQWADDYGNLVEEEGKEEA
jgi:hypothetical protein